MRDDLPLRVALAPYSIPLVVQGPEEVGVVGTGAWVRFRSRELVVTAGHVLERKEGLVYATDTGLPAGIPRRGDRSDEIVAIRGAASWMVDDANDCDLGVLDITHSEVLRAMEDGGFWKRHELSGGDEDDPGEYLLLGYPTRMNKTDAANALLKGRYLLIRSQSRFSGVLPDNATAGLDSPHHGFVDISDCSENRDLGGISGAPVWWVSHGEIYAPESCRWLGVETKVLNGHYYRFTRLSVLNRFLNRLASLHGW